VTVTAPDEVATVPCVTAEDTFTLNGKENAAVDMPEAAVAEPV
jgi:hypothetical protein